MGRMLGEGLVRRMGPHYILAMMIATRVFGSVGGLLVIYYVEFTLQLPTTIRLHFRLASIVVVILGCTLTVLLALWETRVLRGVLRNIFRRRKVSPERLSAAGAEAVRFVGRHHMHEAWLVPCSTLVPLLIFLRLVDGASFEVLSSITLTVFMGISMALMSTFFAVDYCMQPVTRLLLDHGAVIDYESLPKGRLRLRFGVCSALIIMTTALMISVLARQRAVDIVEKRVEQQQALESLIAHSTYITIAAMTTGIIYSNVMTNSVAHRVAQLVRGMETVASGNMSARLFPTGNDEIDILARQFNAMVEQIDKHNRTIQDLNANLELRIQERTRQLEANMLKLKETQAQLVHSEKMSSVGELTAGLAHEINNAINAVYNGIQPMRVKTERLNCLVRDALVADGPQSQDGAAKRRQIQKTFDSIAVLARVIEEGAARTARIVGDLRTFAHPGSEVPSSFDLHAALDMCVNLLANELRNRITVTKDYASNGIFFGPQQQLNQVFLNILKNAQQAITEKGEIFITTRRRLNGVTVSIRDTGVGIPDDIRARIFDPFFTTKEPGVGTGLGLSISYGLISKMGGTVECRSQLDQGADFLITLPEHPNLRSRERSDSLALV